MECYQIGLRLRLPQRSKHLLLINHVWIFLSRIVPRTAFLLGGSGSCSSTNSGVHITGWRGAGVLDGLQKLIWFDLIWFDFKLFRHGGHVNQRIDFQWAVLTCGDVSLENQEEHFPFESAILMPARSRDWRDLKNLCYSIVSKQNGSRSTQKREQFDVSWMKWKLRAGTTRCVIHKSFSKFSVSDNPWFKNRTQVNLSRLVIFKLISLCNSYPGTKE